MERILAGAAHFRSDEYQKDPGFYERLAAKSQKPRALFITCSDSRVDPNLITQTEPGDLFLIRNAGNIIPPHGSAIGGEAATIEYAVEVLNIRHIIVCGHSQCGAMKALISGKGLDHLPAVRDWCNHAEATRKIVAKKYGNLSAKKRELAAIEQNVLVQMNHLSTHPSVAAGLATGEVHTYGWFYDIGSGQINQYDPGTREFKTLADEAISANPLPFRGEAKRTPPVRKPKP